MAASFAYYSLASLVPLLVVAFALLSVFGAAETVIDLLRPHLSDSGVSILHRILSSSKGRGVASVLSLLLSLWSGLKVFRGLSVAFASVYDAAWNLSFVDQVKKGVLVLGLILFSFVLLSVTSVVLVYVQFSIPYPTLVGNVLAVIVLVLAFLPIYYVLPPVPVTVRHTLPGVVFSAISWVVLQIVFFYYAQSAGKYAAYGFLGAILLFITFLYFGGIIILVGAVLNVVIERATPLAELRSPR